MTNHDEQSQVRLRQRYLQLAAFPLIGIVVAVSQWFMGRVWWCEAHDWVPWSWDVWSRHNSQHLVDPYTLSHIQHGIGLFVLLTIFAGNRMSVFARTLVVALVEAIWELAENTDWMIQRYRETTISLDYFGDSILNSAGDFVACLVGVMLARRLPIWVSGVLFVGFEITSLLWIRDSLLLNVLMLLFANDAIRQWQMQGK